MQLFCCLGDNKFYGDLRLRKFFWNKCCQYPLTKKNITGKKKTSVDNRASKKKFTECHTKPTDIFNVSQFKASHTNETFILFLS